MKTFADFYEKFTEENPDPIKVAKLNMQLNQNILALAPPPTIKITNRIPSSTIRITDRIPHRRRRGVSSCDAYSNPFNQDTIDDGREREGNRQWTHVGVIPTCPPTKYQEIIARNLEHVNHYSAVQSGNILISYHGGKWHAGVHPDYG